MSEQKIYDVVIIGSGMGGLTTALILAMEGKSVLVLEKNQQIGGNLQVFSREKQIFDTGVHYIGSLDKGQPLRKVFEYLDIFDSIEWTRMNDFYDRVRIGGKEFKHGQGYDLFQQELIRSFPKEEKAIRDFCAEIQRICKCFPLYNLELDADFSYLENPAILEIDAWEYVNSLTDNKELIAVLLGNGLLFGGIKNVTPFYVVALIFNSYICGSYKMVNGGGQLAKVLAKKIRKYGGDLIRRKEVVGAKFNEDGKIKSVQTSDGDEFFGASFIANLHPKTMIELFGKERFRKVYVNRINRLKETVASFSVYLVLKPDSFPYFDYNIYDFFVAPEDSWNEVEFDDSWPQITYTSCSTVKNQSEFTRGISILTYLPFDVFEKWKKSQNTVAQPGERGDEYEVFKKELEQRIITKLSQRFPNLENAIQGVYSSTPLTYRDYIGSPTGSLYGIQKDVSSSMASRLETRTRIPNLFLTGQNLVFHGILGTTIGAILTSFNYVDRKKLLEKIKEDN